MYDMEYDGRKLYHISLSINNQTNCMGGKKEKRMKEKKTQEGKRPIYGQFANTNTLFSYAYKPP